jgi:hypothetical protein
LQHLDTLLQSRDTDSFTLVSITHIPTSSGRVYDAEGVGAVVAKYPGTPATATFVALWLPYRSSKSAEQVIGLLPEPCERLIRYETHCVRELQPRSSTARGACLLQVSSTCWTPASLSARCL